MTATPPLMPGGESTSARLRRIEQELAEARAELEQERDKSGRYAAAHHRACTMLAAAVQERDAARAKAAQLYADLAEALDELDQAQAATNDKEKT